MKYSPPEDRTPIDSVEEATSTYNADTLYELSARKISKAYIKEVMAIAQLNVADLIEIIPISIDSYKRKEAFDPIVTEKILSIQEVYKKGIDAFGDQFHEWMSTSNVAMGNTPPKSYLKNSFGIRMLIDEIGRLEHGVLA